MDKSNEIAHALQNVHDQSSFIRELLSGALEWPVPDGIDRLDDLGYDWTADELRTHGLEKRIVEGKAFQIRLAHNQSWGIFLLEFHNPGVLTTGRGLTGALRRVLRGLVASRSRRADLPAFARANLLFICTDKSFTHYRFAYFKAPPEGTKTAQLATFGFGPDEPVRTACEFNLPELVWPGNNATPAEWTAKWARAFDVERVTKLFYAEYKEQFERLLKIVTDVKGEDRRMFTQALLNRLMFLRFIERKGWLRAPTDPESKDFLRLLYAARRYRGKSFYQGRLRKLFFEGLAVESRQKSEAFGEVPFLNGGLFEKSPLDAQVHDIPDEAFAPLIGPDGLFYRYNFTVEESTPLNVEVAVDPEMLGKVFEELVTGRHESGAYYTPRPIVQFMCREALKGFLVNAAELEEKTVADLVDRHETPFGIAEARRLISALDRLKAVDPACGSGAYLLGLLHEMVDLYKRIYSNTLQQDSRADHELKLRIISKSIYGVDVDPFATQIAMLRLWLSLAVDCDAPLPLPNLDFKIKTGDSLAGPDPSFIGDMFRLALQDKADALARRKDEYLNCHDSTKHQKLAVIVMEEELLSNATDAHVGANVIDWRIHFGEVFAGKKAASTVHGEFTFVNEVKGGQLSFTRGEEPGGFDIVLANPPYVRQELLGKEYKEGTLKPVFPEVYSGTADLYCYFYARAIQLLRPGGMLSFISSNKWFRAGYGKKLRALVAAATSVRTILDFHDLPVFQTAIAYPMIFIAGKGSTKGGQSPTLAEPATLDPPYPDVTAVVAASGQPLPTDALGTDGTWHLASSSVADRIKKMRTAGPTLLEFIGDRIYRGLTTGLNEAFMIDGDTRASLIKINRNAAEIIKPFAGGKDIRRWRLRSEERWIIVTRIGVDMDRYSAVKEHLKFFRKELIAREDQGDEWWELRSCTYYDHFERTKIVSTKVSIEPTFTLDTGGHYLANTSYFLPVKNDAVFLLAVLNSSSSKFYAQNTFVGKQNGWYEVQPTALEQMPIPAASPSDRAVIAALAQKCLDAKGVDCQAWEKEIDERVAALYGL